MSILRREPASGQAEAGRASTATAAGGTHVGPGCVVRGQITGRTDLLIEGEVEGGIDLEAGTVRVAPSGTVRGPISSSTVHIAGRVVGEVRGREAVEIAPSGSLEGDLAAARVMVAEGAYFKGSMTMPTEGSAGAAGGRSRRPAAATKS
ncbi:MAG TPA: polymer-forming cytoskeletal protein [Thermoanaerobaculia bacterium]|nr:polymer-forming cytoskeletal protein [Thermoanaerobaculia bacterium]